MPISLLSELFRGCAIYGTNVVPGLAIKVDPTISSRRLFSFDVASALRRTVAREGQRRKCSVVRREAFTRR